MAEKKKRSALGSGDVYLAEFSGSTLPEVETLKTSANLLGATKGGASIEYNVTSVTEKSDDGTVSKTVITDEEAKLKTGLCTVDSAELANIVSTARVTEDAENNKTIVKIGGSDNDNGKSYAVLFYHQDKKDGDIAVLIIGKNTAGLTLEFKKDAGMAVSPEFTAEPQDSEGTLIQIIFYHPTSGV